MPGHSAAMLLSTLVATALLPLNGHRCLDSFFQVGNNTAVGITSYNKEPNGIKTLVPTFSNEIIKIDKLVDAKSRRLIGFVYYFGNGERFVAGRSPNHPHDQKLFHALLEKYRPKVADLPQYVTLFPADGILTDRGLRVKPCVPYLPAR